MRYFKNMNMLSKEENLKLRSFTVAVIGCGGLGGYVIEMLARLGIGHLICIDGDNFDESNLNRQLLAKEGNLTENKAEAAVKRVALINSDIEVIAYNMMLNRNNKDLLMPCDLIVDAVDSVEAKLMLQNIAETLDLPLIYGAIAGWYGQVATIFPGDKLLDHIYRSKKTIEKELGNPSFTPATIASLQVAEVVKVLLNKGELLRYKMLFVDLLTQEFECIEFN